MEFGSKSDAPPIAACQDDFNSAGFLFCPGFKDFSMNRNSMRFQAYYPYGYLDDSEGNTPSIEIGKCSPL
jgi:hypothetical protein